MKITDYLIAQHAVFLRMLDFVRKLQARDPVREVHGLKELVLAIAAVLEEHAKIEEEILLKALKPLLETRQDIFKTLSYEDRIIQSMIKAVVSAEDPDKLHAEISLFVVFFRDHMQKEEKEIFPLAERKLGEARLKELGQLIPNHFEEASAPRRSDVS